jgi:hypothetical protein
MGNEMSNMGGVGNQQQGQAEMEPDPSTYLRGGIPVVVNVYHLMSAGPATPLNGSLMGIGAFHSGVEVMGKEWSFGGDPSAPNRSGVFPVPPRQAPAGPIHRSHHVGNLPASVSANTIEELAFTLGTTSWTCGAYNILTRNCNHFAEAFVMELSSRFVVPAGGPALTYPGYINRAAKLGAGLIPPQLMQTFEASAPRPPPNQSGTQQQQPRPQQPSAARERTADAKPQSQPQPKAHAPPQPAPAAPRPARYTSAELETMPLRQLRGVAESSRIDSRGLLERSDYVNAILAVQAA